VRTLERFLDLALTAETEAVRLNAVAGFLWNVGKRKVSLDLYRRAMEWGDAQAIYDYARAAHDLGQVDEARGAYLELVADDSDIASRAAGDLALLVDDQLEKVRLLERAFPHRPELLTELAWALDAIGDRQRLESLLINEMQRGSVAAPILLGNFYEDRLQDLSRAEHAFRVGAKRGDAYSLYNLARLLYLTGRKREGIKALQRAARRGDRMAADRLRELEALR